MKKAHPVEYKEVFKKESEATEKRKQSRDIKKKLTSPSPGQRTLRESFEQKYEKNSDRYNYTTTKLAFFVGSTNVSNSIVENTAFQSLLEGLDPRYEVPGRTLIAKEIDKLLFDMSETYLVLNSISLAISVRLGTL